MKRQVTSDQTLPADYYSEYDSAKTIAAVAEALARGGYDVLPLEAGRDLVRRLKIQRPDAVFNIAEGLPSANRESHVPALLDLLGIPCTGSTAVTLAVALDKAKTKQLLQYEGIPTPAFQLFRTGREPLDERLRFPLIVKPNREGSAKGITRDSVVRDRPQLYRQIARCMTQYRQEILVEEFIDGTELTVGVLDWHAPQVLPILEIDFTSCRGSGEYFYSWRMKEFQGDAAQGLTPSFHCPARLSPEAAARVGAAALRAHLLLGCRDLSRTDIRLSRSGVPYVLEINPLPGLDPIESNFPLIARAVGLSYDELIQGLMAQAFARAGDSFEPALVPPPDLRLEEPPDCNPPTADKSGGGMVPAILQRREDR